MSSSIGMIIPNIWKNTSHVPNHQAVIYRTGSYIGSMLGFIFPHHGSHVGKDACSEDVVSKMVYFKQWIAEFKKD